MPVDSRQMKVFVRKGIAERGSEWILHAQMEVTYRDKGSGING